MDDMRHADLRQAIGAAEDEIFRRFVHPRFGFLLDYAGRNGEADFPDAADMQACRPNAMAWWTPVENGAFFTGLMLAVLSARPEAWRRPQTVDRARGLARALMRLGTVGERPGFVARSIAEDGKSHPPVGSDDQTSPWLYGFWRYLNSGIPSAAERETITAAMIGLCRALMETGWSMPCDAGPTFGYRGSWAHFNFVHAPRLLFAHRIMAELDSANRDHWLRLYAERLHERDNNKGPSRLELCARGALYGNPGSWIGYPDNPPFWISATAQAGLAEMAALETDPAIAEMFRAGLQANGEAALHYISQHRWFDNDEPTAYRLDWRGLNAHWLDQPDIDTALAVANRQRLDWFRSNPRKIYEEHLMREPLWAGWIALLSGDAEVVARATPLIRAAVQHYRWERLYSGAFFVTSLYPMGLAEG
ncbi:MAG: hypothetical protein ACO1OK_07750 [Devosia sp.]